MAIQSMTGFARVQSDSALGALSIELKSVNSRYLDVLFKMPDVIKPFESLMRQMLSKQLARGKIECLIRFYPSTDEQLSIDARYVDAIIAASKPMAEQHDIDSLTMGDLLRLPGVLKESVVDPDALKTVLMPLFEQAVEQLIKQRCSEGEHLCRLLHDRLQSIQVIVNEVSQQYLSSTEQVRVKLYDKLSQLAERYQSAVDDVRFEQEMIYLLQKMDIAEEIDRLNGHISAVNALLDASTPVGRKLDFLMQEMNRESNTIGSKSQSLGITMNAVDLKVLLEQMREQIQNIQ